MAMWNCASGSETILYPFVASSIDGFGSAYPVLRSLSHMQKYIAQSAGPVVDWLDQHVASEQSLGQSSTTLEMLI